MIILLIVGAALILVGGIVAGAAVLMFRGNFESFSTGKEASETYRPEGEFTSIEVNVQHAVTFAPASDGKCLVEYKGEERGEREVKVENGKLVIKETIEDSSFFNFYFKESLFTVYLPKSEYENLSFTGTTGKLKMPKDFSFEKATVTVTTGDVTFDASVSGALAVTGGTGDFHADGAEFGELNVVLTTGDQKISSVKVGGGVSVKASTGKIRMNALTCPSLKIRLTTGDVELTDVIADGRMEVETSTGDVRLKRCDAADIDITVTTGKVSGTLRSAKTFDAHASTGKVDVPANGGTGTCKVRASTGNVKLEIEE